MLLGMASDSKDPILKEPAFIARIDAIRRTPEFAQVERGGPRAQDEESKLPFYDAPFVFSFFKLLISLPLGVQQQLQQQLQQQQQQQSQQQQSQQQQSQQQQHHHHHQQRQYQHHQNLQNGSVPTHPPPSPSPSSASSVLPNIPLKSTQHHAPINGISDHHSHGHSQTQSGLAHGGVSSTGAAPTQRTPLIQHGHISPPTTTTTTTTTTATIPTSTKTTKPTEFVPAAILNATPTSAVVSMMVHSEHLFRLFFFHFVTLNND